MTKLDLSALKKQKLTTSTEPTVSESVPAIPSAEPAIVAPTPPVAAQKLAENTAKPKLSLSSFKKPGAPVVAAPVAQVVAPTPVAPVIQTPVVAVVTPVAPVVETPVVAEVATPVVEAPVIEAPVVAAAEPAPVEETVVASVEPTPAPAPKKAPAAAEFFPNLEFENDNLFSDIVGMGSFEIEKPVVVAEEEEEVLQEVVAIEDSLTVAVPEAVIAPVVELPVEAALPVVETPVVAAAEPAPVEETVVASVEPAAPETPTEYVEAVAKDLSKERKGGLSELFAKRKKIFFGLSAALIVSVGIFGSLYGLGIFEGSKASVIETPPAVTTLPPSKKPTPPVDVEKSPAIETSTPHVGTRTPNIPRKPAKSETPPVLETWEKPATPVIQTSTIRTPNVRIKKLNP